jgi:hypothetical protein
MWTAMRETERRRTDRLFISIPIRVFGIDPALGHFQEETHTLIVNRHGASIVLCHRLEAKDTIRIVNLENQLESNFRVVGRIRSSTGGGAEWGVECLNEEINFWGMAYSSGHYPERTPACALLACQGCHDRFFWPLSPMQIEVLEMGGSIQNYCDHCGSQTDWVPRDPRMDKP